MNSLNATYDIVEPPILDLNFLNNLNFTESDNLNNIIQMNNNNLTQLSNIEEVQLKESDPITNSEVKKRSEKISKKVDEKSELKGSEGFEKAFAQAVKEDPSIAPYKNFLVRTAKRESNFDHTIQNRSGAPYYGYFQFGEAALKTVSNMTMSEFRKDPVAQIKCAAKLYKEFIKQAKSLKIYDLAKSKGYSDDSIAAGAWLAGIGGVKKFLQGRGNPSDSHWYGGKGGENVAKLMEEFK